MNTPIAPDHELEKRLSSLLLDVFIRAGLVLVLAMYCYKIFSPVSGLDVMGSYSSGNHVSDPSTDSQKDWWQTRVGGDPAGVGWPGADRRSDNCVGQFAGRFAQ